MSFRHINLTPFQQEKLKYYFKFFEPNQNNQLDEHSLDQFMKRVLEFTRWDANSPEARGIREIHEAFFEILFDKTSDTGKSSRAVGLEDWMEVWGSLIPGCKGMMTFPVWLRLLPQTLFRMMDRDKDGDINEAELYNFYHEMVKLPAEQARANSKLAYAQMTDNGNYPLDQDGYDQIFSNFLLGGTPYGPGRHIFGCFEHAVKSTPFRLIQPAPDSDDDDVDIKIIMQKRPKRMSLTGL